MDRLAARGDDHFHNQSLNHPILQFNYIDKPSINRAQLNLKQPRREVSFSTYLKSNDTFLQSEANRPVHRTQDSEISIFDAEKYFNGVHEPNNKTTNGGVYTISSNPKQPDIPTVGRLSLSTPKQSVSSISRLSSASDESYGRNYRAKSFHATPTASSEASWNSQSGLLTNPPGLAPVSIRKLPSTAGRKTSKKSCASINWFLRGNICPCSGKKSVHVKDSNSESETCKTPTPPRIVQLNRISSSGGNGRYLYSSSRSSPNTARTTQIPDQEIRSSIARSKLDQNKLATAISNSNLDVLQREPSFPPNRVAAGGGKGFTFPILSSEEAPSRRSLNIVEPPVVVVDGGVSAAETPRDSIDIFQPRDSPKSRRASYDDEICSDASSDLFEIESFSTTAASQPALFSRGDSLDDPAASFNVRRLRIAAFNKSAAITGLAEEEVEEPLTPSIAPTECYPPSEVSVDWSVTTAEGFDRASLAGLSVSASDLGYTALRYPEKGGSGAEQGKRKGNGGLLTSCRCEKAVDVGPKPIKQQTDTRPANTTRSHVNGRAQPPIRVNGVITSDNNNGMHSHGVARSNLIPVPFAAESMAHRHSL